MRFRPLDIALFVGAVLLAGAFIWWAGKPDVRTRVLSSGTGVFADASAWCKLTDPSVPAFQWSTLAPGQPVQVIANRAIICPHPTRTTEAVEVRYRAGDGTESVLTLPRAIGPVPPSPPWVAMILIALIPVAMALGIYLPAIRARREAATFSDGSMAIPGAPKRWESAIYWIAYFGMLMGVIQCARDLARSHVDVNEFIIVFVMLMIYAMVGSTARRAVAGRAPVSS